MNISDDELQEIKSGLGTAFIDGSMNSSLAYRPEFVSNDYRQGKKVVSVIDRELNRCDHFSMSVAFITKSGITPLLQTLGELESRGIQGKILTTDYLTFSEPEALDKLASLKNIELKMYRTGGSSGFHTKGYLFEKSGLYRIIIGSSNMTLSAITTNREWNTKIVGTSDGELVNDILDEFKALWDSDKSLAYEDFIDSYRDEYTSVVRQRKVSLKNPVVKLDQYKLKPNAMQTAFTSSLRKIYSEGGRRALLISATGTGKSYASAFGVRDALMPHILHNVNSDGESLDERPFRILFIVHREQIARQAMNSYKMIFGSDYTYGLMTGNQRDIEADFIFSTVQTLSKSENLATFDKNAFNVIVIDEVHHAGASSYIKIIDYFKPDFLLGMTATPERTDGYDIYGLFDNNIAYEIRLQQAMEMDLLCPFHYFGITDIAFDSELSEKEIKDVDRQVARGDFSVFNRITADSRVDYILEQAAYYGYSGDRVKGLIFVSTRKVGEKISEKMNDRGYRTIFLSGEDSQDSRSEAIDRLTSDDREDYLDYIISVDIFGEGADIPEINQVIMLRPTESAIVFVQQLGRGLRKAKDKEYLVVLDFIGNYSSNFLIPVALSGDRTYNKDNMRKYVMEGSSIIPGSSTIHFDRIAKQRIFAAVDKSSTKRRFLIDKYNNLKNRLGHIPDLMEIYKYGEIDPELILDYSGTYDAFLRIADKDYDDDFTDQEEASLLFISSLLADGKRPHELLMLQLLVENDSFEKETFRKRLESYNVAFREKDYESAVRVLRKEFMNTQSEKRRYKDVAFFADIEGKAEITVETENRDYADKIVRVKAFADAVRSIEYKRAVMDLLDYALMRFSDHYSSGDEDNLALYHKYSRKDVCRILDWEHDDSQTMYGYRIKYGTCPIFVTYEKKEDIAESTKYEDRFIDERTFSWMTRSRVKIESNESQQLIHQKENGLKIYLFIKKSDGEGSDFYYMGQCDQDGYRQTSIKNDKGDDLPIMNFILKLRNSVRSDLYDYFEG